MADAHDAAYAVPQAVADGAVDARDELVAADPIRRLGAYLIDLALVAGAGVLGALSAYALADQIADLSVLMVATYGLVLVVMLAQWLAVGWRGQTLGKLVCRVKIVAGDGAPCGFVRGVLLRSAAPVFVVMLVYWLAGRFRLEPTPVNLVVLGGFVADKLLVFSADSRRLVDRLAGTRVVAVDPLPPLPAAD